MRSLSKDKKGIEFLVELVISVIVLTIILVSIFFIRGKTLITAQVTAESEVAEFACNTNLMNFLDFESREGKTFTHDIQEAWDADPQDTTLFTNRANSTLNGLFGVHTWDLMVEYYDVGAEGKLTKFIKSTSGGVNFDFIKECTTMVPINCELDDFILDDPKECVLLVTMERGYGALKIEGDS